MSRILLAVWILLASQIPLVFADLDAKQTKSLADASKLLEQAEANLKIAKDGLGTGDASPSKKKLALTRLAPVKQVIASANKLLATLPSNESQVVAAVAKAKQLDEALTAMEKSLQAGPSVPAGMKLDYRQREALKNAQFHVTDLVGKATALSELAKKVTQAKAPQEWDSRFLAQGMNTIADAGQKIKNANAHLADLPADGEGVAEVARQLKEAIASIEASEKSIAPAHEKLAAMIDPKNNQDFAADFHRLQDLGQSYSQAQSIGNRYAFAAELVSQLPEAQKEHDRIVKKYALLIQQQVPDGVRLGGASKHFQEKIAEFKKVSTDLKSQLPSQIESELKQASQLADEAIKNQKPAFFGEHGGIQQHVNWAAEKLVLLQSLDAGLAEVLAAKIENAKKELKKRQGVLRDDIIQNNRPAEDRYQGTDRKELEKLAIAAWKKEQPDAQVLKMIIPNQAWERESMWRWQNEWYFIDRSKIQVQLLVKHDDKLAVNRPINLWKDHTSGDTIKAFPMDEKSEELPPQRFLTIGALR